MLREPDRGRPTPPKDRRMCQFFSCISNGKGRIWYFDTEMRQQIRGGKYSYQEDSHTSIADFYKSEIQEDKANKYEFNPFSGTLTIDHMNAKDGEGFPLDDREAVEAKCRALDFNTVMPNWNYVQDVMRSLKDYKPKNPITATKMPPIKKLRGILNQVWDQVGAQVWDQVGAQVWAQVWDQVGAQVEAQVWDQVRDQVRDQVWDQVRDQVWDQVRDQVRDQVWNQVGNQVGDQVWDQVRNQVRDQVRDQVWNQVGDQVWDQVRDQVWDQVRDQVWICAYFAVKLFMSLSFEHPAFDLIRLGVVVVNVLGKFKVFGKGGKFLGEFDEKEPK